MWVIQFRKHNKIKNKLLSLIDKMPNIFYQTHKGTTATKSDWNLPSDFQRDYLDFFYKEINSLMSQTAKKFKCQNWTIHNAWFMQYKKNDKHACHTHPRTKLSAVYYLELPKKELITEFKNNKIKAEEGDILIFPSYMLHRAPVNKSNERKTVISFNCDFYN